MTIGLLLTGCPSKPKADPATDASAVADASPINTLDPTAKNAEAGDAAHGKELVGTYQCNRCHDGTGHPAVAQDKHCVHCHKDIMEGRFVAKTPAALARWKPRVKEYADAPTLEATGKRFTRRFVVDYLLQPRDLRPHLHQYMPRLAITPADARDIAAYLVPDADPPAVPPGKTAPELAGGDLGRGRQLLETKGCGSCHAMSGVVAIPSSAPPAMDPKQFEIGHRLAPDLRITRERMPASKLVAWLKDPKAIKPDTTMPTIALTDAEIKDVAAYILGVEAGALATRPKGDRLPALTRKVTYAEVDEKVFHRTCWHCHSEPDYAIGDGGPGNTGGLGFKPRKLNLASYEGIAAGFEDDKGERQSVFAKDTQGVPRLVRALLARHDEESGAETGIVRGMPLGYDPLAPEDIQLVETWVAQGRPK